MKDENTGERVVWIPDQVGDDSKRGSGQTMLCRYFPGNVSLEDFAALINHYGFIKGKGSHPKARIGNYTMPYKRENPVKVCYVKELLRIIDSV